ncbi:glycosyltransferase [Lichenicola sp.]|uniref:glycosyltransferase n=1 Tax=Lichenicola sp. TaxID=2804529 RepID=UPI003B00EB37
MKVFFTFENPLPNTAADAEVFVTTANYVARLVSASWLHVPLPEATGTAAIARLAGMPVIRAQAPLRPAVLRHLACGLTMLLRRQYWQADLVYTRNLWVAWIAIRSGRKIVFDHYRPWPDQIPLLRYWLYRLVCHRNFLVNICHSDYTREKYLELGIPAEKLRCVRNGFEPERLRSPLDRDAARLAVGLTDPRKTVIYTGRLNHKKGLDLVIPAARLAPELLFVLVGSAGEGPIETMAAGIENIRIVGWQPPDMLGLYVRAADILLIPPSWNPLAKFGSTVLPLKVFLYMASGTPILAGDTPDIREVLTHDRTAYLCRPDDPQALAAGLRALAADPEAAARRAEMAQLESRDLTWDARARRIVDIIAGRLNSTQAERGTWGRAESRVWISQSWRWLLHLLRTRSWVLPPSRTAAATTAGPGVRDA